MDLARHLLVKRHLAGAVLWVATSAFAMSAHAQSALLAGAMALPGDAAKFDLARDCAPPRQQIAVLLLPANDDPLVTWETEVHGLSDKENLRPRWTHELKAQGPMIQFGTFGMWKAKDRPRLAHLAFDWEF